MRTCGGLTPSSVGHLVLEAERALVAGLEGVAIGLLVVGGDGRARLHRADDDAVADQAQARDVRGLGEGFVDLRRVAVVVVGADIARHVVEHHGRARLRSLARVGDGGQRLDVEDDGFGGILGLCLRLGDDEGHRVADEAHLVGGQRVARRRLHRRAVALRHHHHGLQRAIAGGVEVGAGPDAEHARHLARFLGVDALDDAVRDLAAHHYAPGLIRHADIVAVAAFALQQGRVLVARHRLADGEFHQVDIVRSERRVHGPSIKKVG